MKKIMLALLATLMFSSCVTTHMVRYTEDEEDLKIQNSWFYGPKWSGKDENLEVKAASFYDEDDDETQKWLLITFLNKSDNPVVLKSDLLSMIDNENGNAYNLISGETTRIHRDLSQPDFLIPAGKIVTKKFVAKEAVDLEEFFDNFAWKIKQWVPAGDSTLTVTYRDQKDNMEKFVTADPDSSKEVVEKFGTVESSAFYPHIFFINPVDWNRRQLYKKALAKAKSKYGENVELYNLDFVGKWNPLSLVLYFDVFGWCENAKLKADVIKSK